MTLNARCTSLACWSARFHLFLLAVLAKLAMSAAGSVHLTVGETIYHQKTNTTRSVTVEGLEEECNNNFDTLEVKLSENNTVSILYEQTNMSSDSCWFGSEVIGNGPGGTATFSASTSPHSPGICFITARISSVLAEVSVVFGTFADGTVWAEVDDGTGPLPYEPEYSSDKVVENIEYTGDDSGNEIDLMLPYTLEALCSEAGLGFPCMPNAANTVPILNRINLLIAEADLTFMNSNMALRARLVHTYLATDYVEAANQRYDVTLNQMQTANDGFFDTPDLLMLRDQFCADLVALIVRDTDTTQFPGFIVFGQVIGIGPDPNDFSMVSSLVMASITGFTFTHELGHLFVRQSAIVCFNSCTNSFLTFLFLSYNLLYRELDTTLTIALQPMQMDFMLLALPNTARS